MKKLIIHTIAAAALLFAFSGSIFAQTIRGVVKDGTNGGPMIGVTVNIINPAQGWHAESNNCSYWH